MSISDKNELFKLLNSVTRRNWGRILVCIQNTIQLSFLAWEVRGAWTCLQSQVCFHGPSTPVFLTFWELCGLTELVPIGLGLRLKCFPLNYCFLLPVLIH